MALYFLFSGAQRLVNKLSNYKEVVNRHFLNFVSEPQPLTFTLLHFCYTFEPPPPPINKRSKLVQYGRRMLTSPL